MTSIIYQASKDRSKSGKGILYAQGGALFTYNNGFRTLIAGKNYVGHEGYFKDGTGRGASFSRITSFVQVKVSHEWRVIAVDHLNHCIRWIFRTNKSTALLAGNVNESIDCHRKKQDIPFCAPFTIVLDWRDNKYRAAYLTEPGRNRINIIKFSNDQITSITHYENDMFEESMHGLAVDATVNKLFVGGRRYLISLSIQTNKVEVLKNLTNINQKMHNGDRHLVNVNSSTIVDIVVTGNRSLLLVAKNIISELDLETGETVAIHTNLFSNMMSASRFDDNTIILNGEANIYFLPSEQ